MMISILLTLVVAQKETYTVSLTVSGPNCEDCKNDIENGLARLSGFVSASAAVDVAKLTGTATVTLEETALVSRANVEKALRQFTITGMTVVMRGEVVGPAGANLSFSAKGSGQGLVIAPGIAEGDAERFEQFKAAGAGKYSVTAEVVPVSGGGQILRMKSYSATSYK